MPWHGSLELSEAVRLPRALVLALFAALPSCAAFRTDPTFDKPKREDLVGTYTVRKISWGSPDRAGLKKTKLDLRKDGTFTFDYPGVTPSGGFVPVAKGRWTIEEGRGLVIGSIATWGVRFLNPDHLEWQSFGFCLNPSAPYELWFDRYQGFFDNDYLIMRKSE